MVSASVSAPVPIIGKQGGVIGGSIRSVRERFRATHVSGSKRRERAAPHGPPANSSFPFRLDILLRISTQMNADKIIACSRCHCRHHAEDFGVNRLGERWKTCVDCRTPRTGAAGRELDPGYFRSIRRRVVINSQSSARTRIRRRTGGAVTVSVGIDADQYADYIENLFQPGMTWFNFGSADVNSRERWQIDHLKPIGFSGLPQAEYHARAHYTNTRPIWHDDHATKSAADRADMRAAQAKNKT